MKNHIIQKSGLALFACMVAGLSYGQAPVKKFGKKTQKEVVRCASTEYEALLQKKHPNRPSTAQFEQWIAPKVDAIRAKRLMKSTHGTNEVVTIPVVVHIIHNGDAIGTNENIADAQVLSQITVLNQDFRKMLGTPGHNTNPVGADMELEFCLAQRDPNGLSTTGIIRYNIGSDEGWEMTNVEENLKPQTQWDPNQYLNIWVVNDVYIDLGGFQLPLGGYAQFPVSSGLEGLDESGAANTDGVVMGYLFFGSRDIYPQGEYDNTGKDKGRTTTHEVGHYFGLRHIWGDGNGNCDGDDFCDDTPNANEPNQGCPQNTDSCPEPGADMIQNYMDYTNDMCQNIFTMDQKDRMIAVMENSPRRVSLATSLGCVPGTTYDNDGSLNILNLGTEACTSEITPSLMLFNAGNNTITSAVISYNIDNGTAQTYNWTGNLAHTQSTTVQLPAITLPAGNHVFNVSLPTVNNVADQASLNDTKTQSVTLTPVFETEEIEVTIMTDDYGDETFWAIVDINAEEVVFEGGPYNNNQLITETISLQPDTCYGFIIADDAGDGICCDYGNGYYEVRTSNNNIITQGGAFGEMEMFEFKTAPAPMGVNENTLLNSISLYPNPVTSVLNIAMPNSELPEAYTIYNNLGQVVHTTKVNNAASLSINTSSYSNGIYFIKIEKNGQSKTMKFIKN